MNRILCAVAALASIGLVTAPDAALAASSQYTRIPLSTCQVVAPSSDENSSPTYLCEGYGGIPVTLREGDLRWFVSYGAEPMTHTSWSQTLSPFNNLFRAGDASETMVIEWRLNDDGQVYATIQRFYVDTVDGSAGSYLVITRLFPADSCRVAEIAAHKMPDANVVARQLADQSAAFSGCPATPQSFP